MPKITVHIPTETYGFAVVEFSDVKEFHDLYPETYNLVKSKQQEAVSLVEKNKAKLKAEELSKLMDNCK